MKTEHQQEILKAIERTGLVAILRGIESASILAVAETLKTAGVQLVEVTLDTPDALASIRKLSRELREDIIVGAGTVLDRQTAVAAAAAGARFILAPTLSPEVIADCSAREMLPIPGVFTPGEIEQARQAGARIVKIFPAGILGTSYIREMRRLFPDLEFLAVGGIDLDNSAAFIRAGALGLGIGGQLAAPDMLGPENRRLLMARASAYIDAIRSARQISNVISDQAKP